MEENRHLHTYEKSLALDIFYVYSSGYVKYANILIIGLRRDEQWNRPSEDEAFGKSTVSQSMFVWNWL